MDEYLSRFQNLPAWEIRAMSDGGRATVPWYRVEPTELVGELVMSEVGVAEQVATVTAQIQKWGRLEALSKRVWDVAERRYRAWRARIWLAAAEEMGKRPTEAEVQVRYRQHEEYESYQIEIERAEEAYTATRHTVEAWRAKRDMLRSFAVRYRDDGAPRLAV